MIRFLGCVAVFALIAPILVMLYGGVFGQVYTPEQVFAGFILFILGCLVGGMIATAWGELK
jgi:hypothetical protein